jgi:mRNA interferase MazF
MEEGEIILTVLSSDRGYKNRPALILKKAPRYNDYLVCGISSQVHEQIQNFDLLIDKKHPEFSQSGLKYDGLIRLFFLAVIRHNDVKGALGTISSATLHELQQRLSYYLLQK